jgi:hypothetical protein
MAEPQLFESVSVAGVPTLVDGVELQNGDAALVGQVAGLADDRVFSEFLRLMPADGVHPISRAIFPMGMSWYTQQYNPDFDTPRHNVYSTVGPTGSANGSVLIQPFRAFIGSTAPQSSGALQNWRDMRSQPFVGSSTSLVQVLPITANSSGNPRWDLVYAAVSIDVQANSVQRRVKDPSSSAVGIQAVYQYLATTVSIAVVTGTPGATPALPSVPADSGSTFNIALALVLVKNGFNSTSTVVPEDIREVAPVVSVSSTTGAVGMRPGNQQHDRINSDGTITPGNYATDTHFQWDIATPHRSPLFLPPSMVGGESRILLMDFATTGHHSHANGDTLDNSVDWRNRFFKVTAFICNSELFANDPLAQLTTNPSIPFPLPFADARLSFGLGNSFIVDSGVATNESTIWMETDTVLSAFQTTPQVASGTTVALLCSPNTGALTAGVIGNPGCRVFLWVEATAQLANNVTAAP